MAVKENWHLSKNVPIAIIATMILQFAGAIWFFAQLDSAVANNQRDIQVTSGKLHDLETTIGIQSVKFGKVETSLENIDKNMERIERSVSQLAEAVMSSR